nr:MAG TPA: Rubredoxin 2, ELECTRON TRANSPORT [Caudoviricetes sp.]
MAEYIKRETCLSILRAKANMAVLMDAAPYFEKAAQMLEKLPAADVVPVVHAMWILSESDFDDDDTLFDVEEWCDWQCSACREDICYDDPMPLRLLPKFCPNCGAKMDGAE